VRSEVFVADEGLDSCVGFGYSCPGPTPALAQPVEAAVPQDGESFIPECAVHDCGNYVRVLGTREGRVGNFGLSSVYGSEQFGP
jgi:hypothetical protein